MDQKYYKLEGYPGYFIDKESNVYSSMKNGWKYRPVRSWIANGDRYRMVTLRKDKIKKHESIHRLMAKTFIANPEGKPIVCHRNSIKLDNRIENLYWGTASENMIDSVVAGTHSCTKMNNKKARLCMYLFHKFKWKHVEIGKLFGVSPTTISAINRGIAWKHVPMLRDGEEVQLLHLID